MIPTPVKQAQILSSQGFRIMPLSAKDGPKVGGFGADAPAFTCGPEWFADQGTAIGLLCGPCPALEDDWLLGVDLDGEHVVCAAIANFLVQLPVTLTSHNRRHLFFRVPPSLAREQLRQWNDVLATKAATGAAMDLRWAGGYTCERWDWAPGTDTEDLVGHIAELPPEALRLLLDAGAPAAPTTTAPAADIIRGDEYLRARGFDPDEVFEATVAWLESPKAPLPLPGTGHDTLMVVFGAVMVGWGWDDETAFELVKSVWNPRCETPWDEDELETQFDHKIDEINTHGSTSFEELELSATWRNAKNGAALLRDDPPPTTALTTTRSDDELLSDWQFHIQRNQKGEVKNIVFNTLFTLDTHPLWRGLFGLDEFSRNVVFMRDSQIVDMPALAGDIFLEDKHPIQMQAWFGRHAHEPTVSAMIAAVHTYASQHVVHVVRNYLGGLLDKWDGRDRNLTTYIGAEPTPYQLAVCRKWLVSAVARAMRPGDRADSMLVLEGSQGRMKSTALQALCPDVRWFYEAADRNVGGKDFMQDMSGKWLCEVPEVDQLIRSRDGSELKGLLTRTVDTYRPSYGRKSLPFPRQLVFAGTTNETNYLRDTTGNRRFWPVLCGVTGPVRIGDLCDDRDQLWAQAVVEYNAGMTRRAAGEDVCVWWLDENEKLVAEDEAAERLEIDPWSDAVEDWARQQTNPFTAKEALAALPGAKPVTELTARDLERMSRALRAMGLVNKQNRIDGIKARRWAWKLSAWPT